MAGFCSNPKLREILFFYKKIDEALSQKIYKLKEKWKVKALKEMPNLPREKRVEDAGLDQEESVSLALTYA